MGKFGCADVSTLWIDTSKPERPRRPPGCDVKKHGRINTGKARANREDVVQAKKRELTREKQDEIDLERIHGKEAMSEFKRRRGTIVWVGNLQSRITEDRIASIFGRKCNGRVTAVELRRSGGQLVSKGLDIPKEKLTERDRLYASVKFSTHETARRALLYHGAELDGVHIVVSPYPTKMPEQKDIVESQRMRQRARYFQTTMEYPDYSTNPTPRRPLKNEATILLEPPVDDNPDGRIDDKVRMFGLSFAPTIM